MERILIIGCPGAGKSTLSRQMAEKLDLPLIHLDSLFWLPGWKERDKGEFDALLAAELDKPQWIMDGNYGRTLATRLEFCDTVIFLDFGRFACLRGVLKRVITQRGKVRPDMGAGCPERFDWTFLKYVWSFRKSQRDKLYAKLSASPDAVSRIILKNRRQVKKFLESL
jgi:adenylate kinase family enzyme